MSTSDLPNRPAFQSQELGNEFDRPPLSRLAYVTFVAGLVSLCAAFSTILLPLSMLATALGVVVVWRLSRDQQTGGIWLAQLGLAMAASSILWSVSARAGKDEYFYTEAGKHAKVFLETLSSGNKYEALELKQVENARQLTGTDLEKYYSQLSEEDAASVKYFLEDPLTKEVMTKGTKTDWRFVRGISASTTSNQTEVTVEMVDGASEKPRPILVKMRRQLGLLSDPAKKDTTALWNFEELLRP